jgi:putative membrane protein
VAREAAVLRQLAATDHYWFTSHKAPLRQQPCSGESLMKLAKIIVMLAVLALFLPLALVAQSSSSKLSGGDQDFLKKAAEGGKAEVELAQLVLQKTQDPKVRQFAQKMIDDHSKNNQQLQQVGTQLGATLPTDIGSEAQQEKDKLSKLSGEQLDKEYMQFEVNEHQKDISEFQNAASSAQDQMVKNFAQTTLPTLQEHLKLAKEVAPKERQEASQQQ